MSADDIYIKLNERVKELTCLYELSKLFSASDEDIDEVMNKALNVIPKGWQEPNKLSVFIQVDDLKYGLEIPENKGQSTPISINGLKRGRVSVAYEEYREDKYGYLLEEQQLLNQVAREIGSFFVRIEQKEKERLVLEKLKNEDRLNVLAELTAGVAHELNTPLGNIMGYAELLKKSITKKAEQKDLDKIIKSALNAREIVKKLMYFSCEMPTQFNYVNVDKVLRSTVDLLRLQLRDKGIKVRLLINDNNMEVRGDELQLSQVFINLIMNAISASKVNGEIVIKNEKHPNELIIIVRDNGEGIKEENLADIFKPFFTTKKGGTGLGLPVVHGIIQNHGGAIEVKSKVGQGSEFIVKLPS